MSKYIRTKEGKIYDLESKEVSSWEYIDNDTAINEYGVEGAFYTIYYFNENKGHYSEYDGKGGHSCDFIEEKDILKQADTIEELIDEAVFFDDNGKPHYKTQEGAIWLLGAALFKDSLRFGIFTETGLIYVAKMVNKEVVLI